MIQPTGLRRSGHIFRRKTTRISQNPSKELSTLERLSGMRMENGPFNLAIVKSLGL